MPMSNFLTAFRAEGQMLGRRLDMDLSRTLIVLGLALVAAGLLWPLATKLGLGRLPGDIAIEREGFRLYIPIVTSLLVSALATLLFWLFRR
jgi:hypothetical protein